MSDSKNAQTVNPIQAPSRQRSSKAADWQREPLTSKAQSRRDLIIGSAVTLFAERSFADVPATDIAKHAGVSRALMWYHFKTKEEIRDFADEAVLNALAELVPQRSKAPLAEVFTSFALQVAQKENYPLMLRYLQRMLMDGDARAGRAAATIRERMSAFINLVDGQSGGITARQTEVIFISMFVGPIVLKPYFDRLYGVDIHSSDEGVERARLQADIVKLLTVSDTNLR